MDYVKRNKALRILKYLSLLQLFLIVLILILGAVARGQHGEPASGIPSYYLGVFIVGPLAIVTAVIGICIYTRGRHCYNKNIAAQKIGCLMRTYCISLPFNWLGCFVAVLIAAFTGICSSSECSYLEHTGRNYRLAVTIVIVIIMIFVSDVIGLVLICLYASHFGLRLFSRGQYRISNAVPESTEGSSSIYVTNDHALSSLQIQNQLLQQHLQLNNARACQNQHSQQQTQLNQASQQSRQQHSRRVRQSRVGQEVGQTIVSRSQRMVSQEGPIASTTISSNRNNNSRLVHDANQTLDRNNHQRSHRKKKKRRRVRPSHPTYDAQGTSFVLPPILNHGLPPPPPSPPPPPNSPPPPLSDNEFSSSPPPYYVNEHVSYVHDPPPPYTP